MKTGEGLWRRVRVEAGRRDALTGSGRGRECGRTTTASLRSAEEAVRAAARWSLCVAVAALASSALACPAGRSTSQRHTSGDAHRWSSTVAACHTAPACGCSSSTVSASTSWPKLGWRVMTATCSDAKVAFAIVTLGFRGGGG